MNEPARHGSVHRSALAANERFVAAVRAGDAVAAASGYAVDARLVAPSADLIEGRDRIESFWRAGLEAGIRAVELVPHRIDRHESVAFEIGRYAMRVRTGTGSLVDRGSYLLVHQRSADGKWAWALEMFTPDGAPQVASGTPAGEEREVGHD